MEIKPSRSDKIFYFFNYVFITLALLIVLYPLYFIVIASFSNPVKINTGQVWLLPVGFNLNGYEKILQYDKIWIGYRNTILYTIIGTVVNVILTLMAGYSLSRKDLPFRGFLMGIFVFTMFFSGGLIPSYLFIRSLGLYNTFWVMILPSALSVWNLIITRTFFQNTIPDELLEAAMIDGCKDIKFFVNIVIPLSQAIIAVLVIYYAVAHWNSFFTALIYLRDESKFPLQLFLRQVLLQNQFQDELKIESVDAVNAMLTAESMKYGVIIVSSLPVIALYPFLQKYFIKGVMIGAIKG